jgi:hypothetical protein
MEIDEKLLASLIACTKAIDAAVAKLDPPENI